MSEKDPRDEAIERLMAICPHPTPSQRRVYAEWIVDGILAAVRAHVEAAS